MPRYYVTKTWHDFPEGGSFGTVVEADSHMEAEAECEAEMAASEMDSSYGDDDRPDEEILAEIMASYSDEWVTIDCFDLDEFIKEHTEVKNVDG